MADNVVLPGSGSSVAADEIGGVQYQRIKISVGADGEAADLDHGQAAMAASLPVVIASDQSAVPVSVATVPSHAVTNAGTFAVQESGAALTALQLIDNCIAGNEAQVDVITVPAPLSTTGGGTEATAQRVTIASDSTGVLSVDDNGGSLTVDGTVTPASLSGAVAAAAVTVGVTAVALPASALSNRRTVTIYNNGAATIYVGPAAVTTSSGLPIAPGSAFSLDLAAGVVLYGISGSASQNVRVLEVS